MSIRSWKEQRAARRADAERRMLHHAAVVFRRVAAYAAECAKVPVYPTPLCGVERKSKKAKVQPGGSAGGAVPEMAATESLWERVFGPSKRK